MPLLARRASVKGLVLIRAEAEGFCGFAAEGIFEKFFAAFGAEIKTYLLIYVFAYLVVVGIVETLEDVLNFLEVVAVVFVLVCGCRIEGGIDFDFNDVAKIIFRIEFAFA